MLVGDVADVEDHALDLGIGEVVRADDLGREPRAVGVAQADQQGEGRESVELIVDAKPSSALDLVDRVHEVERVAFR